MSKQRSNVYFVDGFSPRSELLGVASYLYELAEKEVEFTRFYMVKNGQWVHLEFRHAIVSLTYTGDSGAPSWWLLGKRGEVIRITAHDEQIEVIQDAGTGPDKLGYLSKIRVIGDGLYCCGYRRQVYRRGSKGWAHIDEGIVAPKSSVGVGFTSIDGTAADDIYAVGWKGEMFHYDGRAWHQIDSPTNVRLEGLRCVSRDLVYACGEGGVVLRGSGNTWEAIRSDRFDDTFWDVEVYQGTPYLAHLRGLMRLEGDTLEPVETGIAPPITGYRLDTSGDVLWSIGGEHVLRFDGDRWEEIVCPDNA